ncbi:chorismate synthase [Streptomyces sp. 5-8]|uniref:Chorismate synthase n=1 Tax=Streptomyces musisoli TaxID=2802280 RepID=A0ABS1NZ50_9ACTN|nr:chorismate synthase [Streptomyces musisoli]MBL1105328.1 chorismate synthase [Streptomyces musisoli]
MTAGTTTPEATVRTVHDVAGFAAVADHLGDVWRTPRTAPPYPAEVLHSLVHAGGAVHAVYAGQRLAGASVAVLGPERSTYSLVAAADRGLGPTLKQAQRDWAVARGARTMRWTFDPLAGRNARFNLVKLGAVGTEYLVDFYGPMTDGLNGGDESDRLTVTWDLTAPAVAPDGGHATPVIRTASDGGGEGGGDAPVVGTAPDGGGEGGHAAPVVRTAPDGGPLVRRDDRHIRCRVPEDVVTLRAADPALALRWRHAVREVFLEAFAEGFRATGMSRDGWYTLTRPDPRTRPSGDAPEGAAA